MLFPTHVLKGCGLKQPPTLLTSESIKSNSFKSIQTHYNSARIRASAGDTFAMSMTPLPNQGQQQPLAYPEAVASGHHHSSGSVGPFFAVLSVITILAVLSCLMGRVCAARVGVVDSTYDCLAWVRRRCKRCIADHAENGVKVDKDDKVEEHPPAAQA